MELTPLLIKFIRVFIKYLHPERSHMGNNWAQGGRGSFMDHSIVMFQ